MFPFFKKVSGCLCLLTVGCPEANENMHCNLLIIYKAYIESVRLAENMSSSF